MRVCQATVGDSLCEATVWTLLFLFATAVCVPAAQLQPYDAPDLMPVKYQRPPRHAPVEIVCNGKPRAVIFVATTNVSSAPSLMIDELVECVRLTSGATLQIVSNPPSPHETCIVIGDCEESRAAGIDSAKLPIEGFVIRTAQKRIFLVGSTAPLPSMDVKNLAGTPYSNDGTAWAVADFLERFVGVRWYWSVDAEGRSVLNLDTITIPPVHYSDAPVFRKREFYPRHGYSKESWRSLWWDKDAPRLPDELLPPETKIIDLRILLTGLRMGNSWPYNIKVHEPQHFSRDWERWAKIPDMFQKNPDGTPNVKMLCYSS